MNPLCPNCRRPMRRNKAGALRCGRESHKPAVTRKITADELLRWINGNMRKARKAN